MAIRFPKVDSKLGLGMGMDLPWGSQEGLKEGEKIEVAPRATRFLEKYPETFSYYFFSFQPKGRNRPDPRDYYKGYDALVDAWPNYPVRALHHTQLNLGTTESYDQPGVVRFTNALVRRYSLKWINEDLGIWSLRGKILPYPLPPFLTTDGLRAAIASTRFYQKNLEVPLLVEFPGFSEGLSFFVGRMDAFKFFSTLVQETESPATFDTGHLISYQWLRGRRGKNLFDGFESLPFENCFEIHLSGCAKNEEKFQDLHHGVLLDDQLEVLDYLIPRCPNLRAITYEDPKFTEDGELIPKAVPNFLRLKKRVSQWAN